MTDNYSATNLTSYPTYKDSRATWIGEIPEHWRITAVKREYEIQMGKMLQPQAKTKRDVEVPYLKALNVQWYSVQTENAQTMWATQEEIDQLEVLTGDLLVCEGGEGGRAAIVNNIPKGFIIQNALHRVRPRAMSQNQFLLHMMKVISESGWFEAINNKATIAHFTKEKFEALQIPIPSAEEQTAIVRYLDAAEQQIQAYISAKQKLIALLEEERQAVIHQALTRGLDPNVRLKPSGVEWLGDVPDHWEIRPLKRWVSTKITDGPHETPVLLEEGIPFMSAEAMVGGRLDFSRRRGLISRQQHELCCRKCRPQIDDIFMCKSGATTGKVAIVDTTKEFSIWSPLALIRVDPQKVLAYLLFEVLGTKYVQQQIEKHWSYGTQPNLAMNTAERIAVMLPPIAEQKELLTYLDKATQKIVGTIDRASRQIELMEEYRTRLIADVVTGKLNVSNAVEQQPDLEPVENSD